MKKGSMVFLVVGTALLLGQPLRAISLSVYGKNGNDTLVQGDSAHWVISGIAAGATVSNEIWFDADSNGSIGPSDIQMLSFSETDGVSIGDGPTDQDGTANSVITTTIPALAFPVGHCLFISVDGSDTARAEFISAPCASPTFSISGRVTFAGGAAAPHITIQANPQGTFGAWFMVTDGSGNYTVSTNAVSGSQWSVGIMDNMNTSGYASSSDTMITLTASVSGINFVLTPGKVITGHVYDTLHNPLADIQVDANPIYGGRGGDGVRTDANGLYTLFLALGNYFVSFRGEQDSLGYLVTYYNQKYFNNQADTVKVTSGVDTVKNIDAVMRKGGIITGHVRDSLGNGIAGIHVYANVYNVNGQSPMSDSTDANGKYTLYVVPGAYKVEFGSWNDSLGFGMEGYPVTYYNQRYVDFNADSVKVSAYGDTVKYIDAVLKFGGIITGRVTYKGSAPSGFCIAAYPYGAAQNSSPMFMKCFSAQNGPSAQGYYYLGALPGSYTIQFSVDTGGSFPVPVVYNQTSWPGNAVVVGRAGDTVKNINADYTPTAVKGNGVQMSRNYSLGRVFPNPMTNAATIRYTLQRQSRVLLSVYNTGGRVVRTVVNAVQPSGAYQTLFSAAGLPSGVYLVKLNAGTFTAIQKVSLVKRD